jgi:hypothetical protein
MGMFPEKNCSSSPYAIPGSNPDPRNFKILRERVVHSMLILEVEYPDAKNFEGRKIMIYTGFDSSKQLLEVTKGVLNPHFAERGVSLIARFRPDNSGWSTAVRFARSSHE